jgi:hypothetical protein
VQEVANEEGGGEEDTFVVPQADELGAEGMKSSQAVWWKKGCRTRRQNKYESRGWEFSLGKD